MPRITITFDTDNAAFDGHDYHMEVERVLLRAAFLLRHDLARGKAAELPIRDSNGNSVGSVKVEV